MNKADEEALDSSYKLAQREINAAWERATVAAARAAATERHVHGLHPQIPGDMVKAACEAIDATVPSLIDAHWQASQHSVDPVAIRIRAFVESQTCHGFPGQEQPLAQHTVATARASFNARRAGIGGSVRDRVATAFLAERAKTTRVQRMARWAENHRFISLVLAAGAVGGWLKALYDVVAFFVRRFG